MSEGINKVKQKTRQYWSKLSNREKGIIAGMVVAVAVVVAVPSYEAVSKVFSDQKQDLKTAQASVKGTPKRIAEYLSLQKRRDSVRERYKKVEIKQGVRSHIESLVKTHIGPDANPNIQNLNIKKIGEGYVQEPFKVSFNTNSIKTLTKFLEQLVEGPQPLALSRLVIKRVSGDKLSVSLDTSSIRSES